MMLREIDTIPTPRLYRDKRWSMVEKFNRIRKMVEREDFIRFATAGAALVAVVSCMVLFASHHNMQLANMKARLRRSELEWKRRSSQLETRAAIDSARLDQWVQESAHSIAKRAAEEQDGVDPLETYHDLMMHPPVGGSVYIRWGRMDCPELGPSRLIYFGVMSGTYFSHTGGGSNYLCLHANVTYEDGHFVEGFAGASYIYGTEYRDTAWAYNLFDLEDTMTNSLQYHSVPCALCMAEKRHGHVMIPGRHECPEDWVYEYDGYIMANGHSNKHSTEFICVDKRPQVVPGTTGNQNGAYLWLVETKCESLHCEPVVSGREIRCVVCTV